MAVVVSLNLFFRTLGGAVGIAQLAAVLNSRVRTFIGSRIHSGEISPQQALQLLDSLNSLDSANGIFNLPPDLQAIVNNAFKDGLRWAFISLIPWSGVACILVFFLSRIPAERLGPAPTGRRGSLLGLFGGLFSKLRAARRSRRAERRARWGRS